MKGVLIMSKKYCNEEELKKALQIKDWRGLTKDKVLKLIQMSPDIDKEVYMKILDQVPQLVEETKIIIQAAKETIETSKTLSLENKKYYMNVSNKILELIDSEKLSDALKKELIDLIKIIADYMDKADIRDKSFLSEQLAKIWEYAGKALLVFAAIFGVKFIMQLLQEDSEQ
jgi:hypothetical protein